MQLSLRWLHDLWYIPILWGCMKLEQCRQLGIIYWVHHTSSRQAVLCNIITHDHICVKKSVHGLLTDNSK